jgi:hypothetical protein
MNKGMFILLLLTLLLNGCALFPDLEPEIIYQDNESASSPNAVIETTFCSYSSPKIVSLSIWRVSDDNKREQVYYTETLRELLCPVVKLKPGVYFIAFDAHVYKKGDRGSYGKIVMEAGQRYVFQYDEFVFWWTVWLQNAEKGEVVLGSKVPY